MLLKWQNIYINKIRTKKILKTEVIEYDIRQGFDVFFTEPTKLLGDFEFYNTHLSCSDFVFVEGFDKRLDGVIKNKEDTTISFKFELEFGFVNHDEEGMIESITEEQRDNIIYQAECALIKAIDFAIGVNYQSDIVCYSLTSEEIIN